jgi:lysophospholipase L1-like esterase
LSLVVLLALPFVLEFGFRAVQAMRGADTKRIENFRDFLLTGRPERYVSRAYTVFQRPSGKGFENSYGFSDRDWPLEREEGEVRILCLGGSTTESGNTMGQAGSYPRLLEAELERRTGRRHRVMNAGISGWTTAEMLASWFLLLRDFAPDVLVLHEGVNDLHARFQAGFLPDYSHWRRPMPSSGVHGLERWLVASDLYLWLRLRRGAVPNIMTVTSAPQRRFKPTPDGLLPPETARSFARNLASIARDAKASGTRVVLMTMPARPELLAPSIVALWRDGLDQHARLVRELCAREGYDLVDAALAFEEHAAELDVEFLDTVHLSPTGNAFKAKLLADCLVPDEPAAAR